MSDSTTSEPVPDPAAPKPMTVRSAMKYANQRLQRANIRAVAGRENRYKSLIENIQSVFDFAQAELRDYDDVARRLVDVFDNYELSPTAQAICEEAIERYRPGPPQNTNEAIQMMVHPGALASQPLSELKIELLDIIGQFGPDELFR